MLFYYRGGCLVLPPTAPNCKELQAVKGYIWNVTLSGFFRSDFMQAVQLGIWFRQQAVKVGLFLLLYRQNIAVFALNCLVCPLIADSDIFTLGECQGLKRPFSSLFFFKVICFKAFRRSGSSSDSSELWRIASSQGLVLSALGLLSLLYSLCRRLSPTSCSLFTVEKSGLNLSDSSNRENVQAVKVWNLPWISFRIIKKPCICLVFPL